MFFQLLKKELNNIFKSITFYGLIFCIGFFFFSQCPPPNKDSFKVLSPDEVEQLGIPVQAEYGSKKITDSKKEIRAVYMNLYRAYVEGKIYKERLMLNTKVKLNDNEKQDIKDAMESIASDDYIDNNDDKLIKVSYDEYLTIIEDLNKKLGGSTNFDLKHKDAWINEPKTYEDAANEIKEILEKDKLTNAVARVVADYMGITAGFFPIFLSAFILVKDKRSKMEELICSRSISSNTYIISKYLALSAAILIPYILIATYFTIILYNIARINNYSIDVLAFYKYTIWWVTPTILFTVAIGMLISVIFNNGVVAIAIQFILWISFIMPLYGNYSLNRFVIRFNELGMHSEYIKWANAIMINRIFYIVLSMVLVLLTSYIWSWKRRSVGEHIK